MNLKNILRKYEKLLIPLLLVLLVILLTTLVSLWWQFFNSKPATKPGDFLQPPVTQSE